MKIPPCEKKPSATRNITLTMALGLLSAFLAITAPCARAFSLLGPYAPWMDEAKSFKQPGRDIGGPMNSDEGYRWNAPVVTCGFDASFLEYFGSNGVDKIAFVRHPFAAALAQFLPMTNQFTDNYVTNGAVQPQHLERM